METAEEYFDRRYRELGINHEDEVNGNDVKVAIEFAQLHLEKAIKNIANSSLSDVTEWSGNPYSGEGSDELSEKKILELYPLSNIK